MKSLLTAEAHEEINDRLSKLTENSKGNWGKMTVGQMAWHCQYPLKLAIKNKENTSDEAPKNENKSHYDGDNSNLL